MDLQEALLDMDAAVNRLSSGVSAAHLMSLGLLQMGGPYAGGFEVLCGYLSDAERELRAQVDLCLEAV